MKKPKIYLDVYHNIAWAHYKAAVFNKLDALSKAHNVELTVYHIAETEINRECISAPSLTNHKYKWSIIFPGAYERIGVLRRLYRLGIDACRSRADVVLLCGFSKPEYFLQAIIFKFRKKLVGVFVDSTLNDRTPNALKTIMKKIFINLVEFYFCYGQRSKEYLESLGANTKNIFIRCQASELPKGFEVQSNLSKRINAIDGAKSKYFLYVGRLSKEKGLDTLIDAFRILLVANENVRLVIVGAGPEEQRIRSIIKEHHLERSIELTGPLKPNDVNGYYRRAYALVLPSRSEPWGLVANEALANGCPIIVSDKCGCVPELADNKKHALVFKANDVGGLQNAMSKSLTLWENTAATALSCLTTVSKYTPQLAAESILSGVQQMYSKKHDF